ncbi:hypothetical protein HMPREF9130_1208 [Peptoniphilus sp. oral taxon 375 str. F0436]|nr:hypothetical protein HMPREF9130_1208 [Peptoniphilus sp. oral taxon 375 str. F0436]
MALFKSKEEKDLEKQAKEKEKIDKFLSYYNLDDIDERDRANILDMARQDSALSLLDTGTFLSGDEKDFLQQIAYQQQLIRDQNFLMIKQLDRLNKNLEKLLDKDK